MTDPKLRLPVEPLSERAWQRVQEGVLAELRRPVAPERQARMSWEWRQVSFAGAAVLAVAVVALLLLRPASTPVGLVATSTRIAATKEVTRTTVGDVTVEVTQGTELVVTGAEGGQQTVVLERGRAEFSVPKRKGRPAFRVHAAEVLVEVIGTQFWVVRSGSDVRVGVRHGAVSVRSRNDQVRLNAGDEWPSKAAESSIMQAPPGQDVSGTPSALAPAPARRPQVSPQPVPRADTPKPEGSAVVVQAVASPRDRYEAASRLEVTDPTSAVQMYLVLARDGGPWAANGLYAAGRLEMERGRRDAARQLLTEYLSRFPRGTNAREATMLLERAR